MSIKVRFINNSEQPLRREQKLKKYAKKRKI